MKVEKKHRTSRGGAEKAEGKNRKDSIVSSTSSPPPREPNSGWSPVMGDETGQVHFSGGSRSSRGILEKQTPTATGHGLSFSNLQDRIK